MLINSDDKAFAQLSAIAGIKFGTPFTDGSWIISASLSSIAYKLMDDTVYLNKIGSSISIEDAWRNHQKKVEKLVASGKQVTKQGQAENYLSWCHHADSANQQMIKSLGTVWLFLVVFLLSFALLHLTIIVWPQMPNLVLVILRLLPLLLPLIAVQLYTKQFGDLSQSTKRLKN